MMIWMDLKIWMIKICHLCLLKGRRKRARKQPNMRIQMTRVEKKETRRSVQISELSFKFNSIIPVNSRSIL